MFEHRTSSARYPQSNVQVERAIQTTKNIIRKSELDGTDVHLSMLEFMNTPISNTLPSATRILHNRHL